MAIHQNEGRRAQRNASLRRERALITKYLTPALRALILKRVGRYGHHAEDITQNVLVVLTRKPEALLPENAALMTRIIHATAASYFRDLNGYQKGDAFIPDVADLQADVRQAEAELFAAVEFDEPELAAFVESFKD